MALGAGPWRASTLLVICLLGCGADGEPGALSSPLDREPDAAVAADGGLALPWPALRLSAAPFPEDNPPSEAKRLLGRVLFYDPILSGDRATACVTCHSEIWGLGDQLGRSVGLGGVGLIGPGRTGPHVTRRNAQPLWNLAYRTSLFWDGRVQTLEEQVFAPLESEDELARPAADVIADLAQIPEYVLRFRAAFPEAEPAVSQDTFAKALATFMRAYVSDRATYDQYLAGDTRALDASDLRGLALFAELRCHDCHVPPRFDSDRFADRHVPAVPGIEDQGRFEVTSEAEDRGAFRVPTLRNARETGPYFHNGAVARFDDAIRHEVDEQLSLTGHEPLREAQLADLTSFLRRALSDTSRNQFPPSSLPSGLAIPLDGDRFLRGGHAN
jgi:cytochrome c peroxidase